MGRRIFASVEVDIDTRTGSGRARELRLFTSFVITRNQVPMNHPLSLDGVQPLQVSRCIGEQRSGCVVTCVLVAPSA